ncbi:MAG: HAMP domain-containing histidine kinase [Bifidobacteriaceae bacterium]|jgi:two-component system sensor histidine kinase VanS|nr:HAMP domain-containing histidine kinase [Bifidobacteriaceae bacterium]
MSEAAGAALAVNRDGQGARARGLSARWKLTFSYVGLLVLAGALLLAVVAVFLLRYVPAEAISISGQAPGSDRPGRPELFIPGRDDLWRAFAPKAAAAMAALLAFGLVGGWLLAGRMLAPLGRIADATRQVAAGSLSHRIDLTGRNDEFVELADAFDTMTARLEAHVAEQRRFAANASHELRTPLAIAQSLLDVARQDPDRDTDQLLERLQAVNARAIALTEALLSLSRADQPLDARTPVDLSLLAEEAVELFLPLAEARGIVIETAGQVASALGSRALLAQMTANLVQNGIVHNLPDGGAVSVVTAVAPGLAVLSVENTGPELTPELVATLAEPFQRGGERIRGDHPGVGLGLAIVNRIVQAHDGHLALAPRPGGGLEAVVRLPAGA